MRGDFHHINTVSRLSYQITNLKGWVQGLESFIKGRTFVSLSKSTPNALTWDLMGQQQGTRSTHNSASNKSIKKNHRYSTLIVIEHLCFMSDYLVYIKMPSYLRQWFIHRHSGSEPVVLRQGCIETKILRLAQSTWPQGQIPAQKQEGEVAVCIPYSKARDPRTYNYIVPSGKKALLEQIKNDFAVDCWTFLHDFGKIGQQQKQLIYLFMEQRGIKEDGSCWDSIAKTYQRLRKNYLTNESRRRAKATSVEFVDK